MSLIDQQRGYAGPRLRGLFVFSTLSLAVAAGCGSGNPLSGQTLYPVKGKIVLHDGKPLAAGRVGFFVATKSTLSIGRPSSRAMADSTFKSPSGDGLPAGEYRVVVEPALDDAPEAPSRNRRRVFRSPESTPMKTARI